MVSRRIGCFLCNNHADQLGVMLCMATWRMPVSLIQGCFPMGVVVEYLYGSTCRNRVLLLGKMALSTLLELTVFFPGCVCHCIFGTTRLACTLLQRLKLSSQHCCIPSLGHIRSSVVHMATQLACLSPHLCLCFHCLAHLLVCLCVYVCMCVCMYVCMYVCTG